jgi:hypothetical protein
MNNPALLGLCGLGGIFDLDRDGISDLYLTCSELMFASSSVVSLNEDNPRVFFEVDHYEETRGNEDGALNKSYTFYDISLSFQDLNGDGKLDIIETKASVDGDASEKTTRQHITE